MVSLSSGYARGLGLTTNKRAGELEVLLRFLEVRLNPKRCLVMRNGRIVFTFTAKDVGKLFVGDLKVGLDRQTVLVMTSRLGPKSL